MRLIDADALLQHQNEADKMGAMLVVGKGFILDAPTIVPQPDPTTGLVPCGCGGKAILFHQPDIEGPGSDGDRWAVFCEKTCGMGTSDLTSREYAVETWNTGMGHKGGAE